MYLRSLLNLINYITLNIIDSITSLFKKLNHFLLTLNLINCQTQVIFPKIQITNISGNVTHRRQPHLGIQQLFYCPGSDGWDQWPNQV